MDRAEILNAPALPFSAASGCPQSRQRIFSGVCHGTLGELLQGPFVSNRQVCIGLISLPIKRYSWMHFTYGDDGDLLVDLAEKEKCRRVIELYLSRHRRALPRGRWSCESELLQGKGMASSTADMVATIRCLDALFGTSSPHALIADLLRQVERSDSVFLDTYALYLSARQKVIRYLGSELQFHACYIDEGHVVDTEQAGPALLTYYQQHLAAYQRNLDAALDAFRRQDSAAIAHCATISARLSQGVVPKQHLDTLLSQQRRFAADGIVVAHTGSLIGYLFVTRPDPVHMGELSAFFRSLGHQCRFAQTGF
ncbi:MAG: hypothetical protein JNN30_05780 [Rhodanobacteraceae bacterium]|nr:hypothetical protein [Rhodanobacteraceae bacterium]